jgi:hypothetical protein
MSSVVLLSVGVLVALTLPIGWRAAHRRFDPFEPVLVFALAWGVMFVVRPIAIVVRDDTSFYGVDIGPTLPKAVLLGLVGAVAFIIGYELTAGRRLAAGLPAAPESVDPARVLGGAVVVSALGVLALALVLLPDGVDGLDVFLNGRSGELNALIESSTLYLWYGSLFVIPAALAGFTIALTTRTTTSVVLAVVLIGLALLRTLPTGNRIFLLVLFGGMLVFAFLHRARRPGVTGLVVGLAGALLLSYAVLVFRTPDTRSSVFTALEALAEAPQRLFRPLTQEPDAEMAPALAGALIVVPDEFGYRFGGATFGDLILRPIPRELWSGKPEIPGRKVTAEVWPVARETGSFDPAFTPLLSFYWDFGIPGAFVGMALIGVLARALYEYLLLRPRSFGTQLLYSGALWYVAVTVRHDPVSVFIWGLVLFVPLIGILAFASRRLGVNDQARSRSTPPIGGYVPPGS